MKTRTLRSPARGPRGSSRIRAPRRLPKPFAQLLKAEGLPPKAEQRTTDRRPQAPPITQELVAEAPSSDRSREEPTPFESFSPLPSVVGTPVSSTETAAAGTRWDRAQVAAMAERMLTSFRHGQADGRDEVRMQLRVLDAEVRVRIDDGRIVATLVGDGLEGLASTLKRELKARGLQSDITISPE